KCSGLSPHIYEAMKLSSGVWICPSCGMPSFASSLFDSSSETFVHNSFGELDHSSALDTSLTSLTSSTPHRVVNKGRPHGLRQVKVASNNINSLRGKSIQLLEMIHSNQPDIILCQETKLDETILSSELFPDSCSVFRKDKNLNGGGVSNAVNKMYQAVECHDLDNDLEAIWIQLQTSDHFPVYICSLYRPPYRDQEYIEALRLPLELLLNRHHNKPPLIVVAGDMNYRLIDWSSISAPSINLGSNFIDILNDFYLQQLVTCPTRVCSSTSSILDLVICSHPASVNNLVVGREISDHCLITFNISLLPIIAENIPRRVFVYSKGNYDQLRSDLNLFSTEFFDNLP